MKIEKVIKRSLYFEVYIHRYLYDCVWSTLSLAGEVALVHLNAVDLGQERDGGGAEVVADTDVVIHTHGQDREVHLMIMKSEGLLTLSQGREYIRYLARDHIVHQGRDLVQGR